MPTWFRYLLIPFWLVPPATAAAETLTLAVAANFAAPLKELAEQYAGETGTEARISVGSTGTLYAQIRNGAPFDAFFAADVERPRKLEAEGLSVADSRFTYAVGRLVLWSPKPDRVNDAGSILATERFTHLAIANPRLAPYGLAARQTLEKMGLWEALQPRLVRGENIGQTFHFVGSGHAELGFVALSQLPHDPDGGIRGSHWRIPAALYDPIEQQAVSLQDTEAVRDFMRFVRSDRGRALIRRHGYATPAD